MMTDQHLPLLEATPMLAEMPLYPHMLSRDGMQQVSEPVRSRPRSSDNKLFASSKAKAYSDQEPRALNVGCAVWM
ncbi:fibronectin type-III domain-containing protein 3A-like isoform X1 [Tachysurus ichikawai]